MATLLMLFGLLAPQDVSIISLSNLLIMSVPNEDYYKNALCALN